MHGALKKVCMGPFRVYGILKGVWGSLGTVNHLGSDLAVTQGSDVRPRLLSRTLHLCVAVISMKRSP